MLCTRWDPSVFTSVKYLSHIICYVLPCVIKTVVLTYNISIIVLAVKLNILNFATDVTGGPRMTCAMSTDYFAYFSIFIK